MLILWVVKKEADFPFSLNYHINTCSSGLIFERGGKWHELFRGGSIDQTSMFLCVNLLVDLGIAKRLPRGVCLDPNPAHAFQLRVLEKWEVLLSASIFVFCSLQSDMYILLFPPIDYPTPVDIENYLATCKFAHCNIFVSYMWYSLKASNNMANVCSQLHRSFKSFQIWGGHFFGTTRCLLGFTITG